VAIGRCAVQANEILRSREVTATAVPPILEFCFAFPASTWTSGSGGGLAPGASFTGVIANDVLTVSAPVTGVIVSQQTLQGPGVASRTLITSTGTGGAGTYNVGVPPSAASTIQMSTPGAVFLASLSGCVMSVSQMISGTISVGEIVSGPFVTAGLRVASQASGTAGGVGNYNVSVGPPQNVASAAMTTISSCWQSFNTIAAAIATMFPTGKYLAPRYVSMGYTQADSTDHQLASKEADLTAMMVYLDSLALPGGPLTVYFGYPASPSESTVELDGWRGTYTWLRTHAPGRGGTYSGRVFASTTWHQWPFDTDASGTPLGDIHTGEYGSIRHGEVEGYVRHLVQDKGIAFTPLWRAFDTPITVAGQAITIPFARPNAPDFAATPMTWQSNPDDGIKVWPNQGFNARRGTTNLTIVPVINGLNVVLTVSETLSPGDVLEVSYAHRGPGGPVPGPCAGIGGNLVMQGPPSVLFPNGYNGAAKSIDLWAWPFIESVTA
jgi:hypothetical protein